MPAHLVLSPQPIRLRRPSPPEPIHHACLAANRLVASLLQPVHDLRLVWPPEDPQQQALDHRSLISWGIALFEYLLQVPANRIGYTELSVGQLKIMQEVITLAVFVPFSVYFMQQPLKLDYLWAGLCLLGAVYFIFRA